MAASELPNLRIVDLFVKNRYQSYTEQCAITRIQLLFIARMCQRKQRDRENVPDTEFFLLTLSNRSRYSYPFLIPQLIQNDKRNTNPSPGAKWRPFNDIDNIKGLKTLRAQQYTNVFMN